MKFDIGFKLSFKTPAVQFTQMTQEGYYRLGLEGIILGLFIFFLIGGLTVLQRHALPVVTVFFCAGISVMGALIAICGVIMRIRMRRFWLSQPTDLCPDRSMLKE